MKAYVVTKIKDECGPSHGEPATSYESILIGVFTHKVIADQLKDDFIKDPYGFNRMTVQEITLNSLLE